MRKFKLSELKSGSGSELRIEIANGFKEAASNYDFRDKTLKTKAVATDMFGAGVKWAAYHTEESEPEVKEVPVTEVAEPVATPEIVDYSDAIDKIVNWVHFEIKSNFRCTMMPEREEQLKSFLKMVLEK